MTHQVFIYFAVLLLKKDVLFFSVIIFTFTHDLHDISSNKKKLNVFFHFPLLPLRDDPPNEPVAEAPPKPLPSDDEDEVEDNQPEEAHYDSLEKASTPPADCWAVPQCKPAVSGSLVHNGALSPQL